MFAFYIYQGNEMKKNYLFPVSIATLIALLVFFEPSYGWKIRNLFVRQDVREAGTKDARLENEALRAELAKLRVVASQLPDKPVTYMRAIVYSRYPMNFKKELLIDRGARENVAENAAVVFGGALIGRVAKVFDETSLVETTFDNRFRTPVRIGLTGINALFEGGTLPSVALIPLKAEVSQGDIVYSASPDFPYALPIATIGDIKMSADNLFREATLNFAYDINSIQTVLVAKR